MTRSILIAMALAAAALVGCSPNTSFLIRPIGGAQGVSETVLARDRGLFVTDKIAILDLDGLILNERRSTLFSPGENPVSLFVEKVDAATADRNVKAVVLRINSPGGGVTASDILYRRLARLRQVRGVPIVACIEDVGASGGYYVACSADSIIAHPTSLVGSIGVIVQTVSFAGTMRMLGVTAKAVTSGENKDLANPLKPLDPKELAILQGIVDSYYSRFLSIVAENRILDAGDAKPRGPVTDGRKRLNRKKLEKLADGRVYAAEQALAEGLVDDLGYMDDALALARKLAGIHRAKIVIYGRPWKHQPHAYATTPAPPAAGGAEINLLKLDLPELLGRTQPRAMYLWTGQTGD